jgi:integrase
MAKAKKLPSGNWRVNLYIGKENGKRVYKSFTSPTRAEAEYEASKYRAGVKERSIPLNMSLGEAMDKYIEMKSNVLSPTTIREYKRCRNNDFKSIINEKLSNITQELIQISINELAAGHSPKLVRNAHGFLSAVFKVYNPYFILNTTLPQKKNNEIQIPSESEVTKMLIYVKDTVMEIPLYLAAVCGLRRSDICGLKWDCINLKKQTIRIKQARVKGEKNQVFDKGTKSRAGERTIRIYPFVIDVLSKEKNKDGYVTSLSGDAIYDRYDDILRNLNIQHYRFHDLRHYVASVMLSLNIPKKYIADYLGHETENMIDRVYGHIMKEKKSEVEDQLETYYTNLMQHETQQDNVKA